MTEAWPLHWPDGWPRTSEHRRKNWLASGAHQRPSWTDTMNRLFGELRRLGARNVVLSTNQPLRQDGLPYANRRLDGAPGAAVYFTLNERDLVMAQDLYWSVADNIRSLALAIEGMRQMKRHGGGHMMERAFAGFTALPPPSDIRPWREILGECANLVVAEACYKRQARERHPDAGGSDAAMAELNVAMEAARAELGG